MPAVPALSDFQTMWLEVVPRALTLFMVWLCPAWNFKVAGGVTVSVPLIGISVTAEPQSNMTAPVPPAVCKLYKNDVVGLLAGLTAIVLDVLEVSEIITVDVPPSITPGPVPNVLPSIEPVPLIVCVPEPSLMDPGVKIVALMELVVILNVAAFRVPPFRAPTPEGASKLDVKEAVPPGPEA